ncbi:MAG TPA: selenocysteine-specific translation elongation factor [Polyangiaceae bacterium]|jgi:selenocysteine-specific elongation factor
MPPPERTSRRFVVGTAGHVDHGKTTLVRALTGVDTDRLPEEKRRGISIELGFAPLDLGEGLVASVVDVPGHRRLVRAMIAGATGMELVMLVVAADEGVMPQTREHVAVCELLGVTRAVVVVTKADAVDAELAAMAGEEARGLLGDRWTAEVVGCSAKTGAGLDDVRAALRRALRALPPRAAREHVRMGVDRVFTVHGAGTVVTGTLVAGRLKAGAPLFVVGEKSARETAARGLHVHDRAVEAVEAPTRLAINLASVALDAVKRGDVVTTDGKLRATTLFDVLARGTHALARGAAVTAHVGTAAVPARLDSVTSIEGGAVARVRTGHAVAVAGGDRVVLRGGVEGPSGAVVGGGVVLDARPDRRASGAKRRTLVAALASLDPDVTARALVQAASPRPLLREGIASRFAVDAVALVRAAERAASEKAIARAGDQGWIARDRLDALVARARDLVRAHHERAPLERGLPLETLRARLAVGGGRVVAEEAIRVASSGGAAGDRLVVEGDVVRLPGSASAAGADAAALAASIATALAAAGSAGTTEHTLAEKTSCAPQSLRAALQRLARDGAAVRLGELWFAKSVVDDARAHLTRHFAGARTLSVIEFKAATGLARKQAVAMLEHFDALGLTRREGDARVLR